jgi:2-haloacid dehalogenase
VPGPIPGTPALVDRLADKGVPLYAITNFGDEAFELFRPTMPVLGHMRDIVVSGVEKLVKPGMRSSNWPRAGLAMSRGDAVRG